MTSPRHACLFATAAVGLLVATAVPAAAQGTEEERRACTPDVMRLCREYIPNVERITACLVERGAELNPDCRLVMFPPEPSTATAARHAAPSKPAARRAAAKSTAATAARKPAKPMNLLPAADKPAVKKKPVRPRAKQAQRAQ